MLIRLEVETELTVIIFLLRSFEWLKQVSGIIHGKQKTAQDSHDFHNGTANLHVVFDDTNEAGCEPIQGVDIMDLSISDSVEYRDLCDDINLSVDSYSRLGRSELRPPENREEEVNRCGINRIDSVCFGKNLPVDSIFPKAEEKRFVSMGDCYICKFPETPASKQLTKHKNQQMAPMGKRPSSCAIVVFDHQAFEESLRKELGYLRKNIVTRMHVCSIFDLDAKERISKVRQTFRYLCNCA